MKKRAKNRSVKERISGQLRRLALYMPSWRHGREIEQLQQKIMRLYDAQDRLKEERRAIKRDIVTGNYRLQTRIDEINANTLRISALSAGFIYMDLYADYCQRRDMQCSPAVIIGLVKLLGPIPLSQSAELTALRTASSHFITHCFDIHAFVETKTSTTIDGEIVTIEKCYDAWIESTKRGQP